ncbi:hypothetical protein GCM10022289_31620 [Pedobacter jeongneungensis]|uniref:Uncharacterized protein n=1 Tax=Pedobacter jeongneungensis TaxID=947309 RepID=A0ABP8BJ14_9SPHI
MKTIIKFNVTAFESIHERDGNHLIGGFSASFANNEDSGEGGGETNNCQGGNCRSTCGEGQNIQCNTKSLCGV